MKAPAVNENGQTEESKVALSADHEVRLERLEHQLAHILYKPSTERVRIIHYDNIDYRTLSLSSISMY